MIKNKLKRRLTTSELFLAGDLDNWLTSDWSNVKELIEKSWEYYEDGSFMSSHD